MTKHTPQEKPAAKISHHGHRIKHARRVKGYTLRQLADLVECSESMISKLENSRLSPSLSMLNRLAVALDTTVPDLLILDGDSTEDPVTIFPSSRFDVRTDEENTEGMLWFDRILPFETTGLLQISMLHLRPGGVQPRALSHEGEEFIFVLDGLLDVIVEEQSYPIGAGGAIYFDSRRRHRYANTSDTVARALWINTPPTLGRDGKRN